MSTIVTLADAVVSELNGKGWSLPFAARRLYRPRFEPADLKTLQVSVVPRALTIEAASRSDDGHECQIDVAVQQKLDADSVDQIDLLMGLVDEIVRHFRLRRPAAMPEALCVKVQNDPVYAVEHLEELRTLTSIITLTFRVMKD
ncbi:hypothetical protein JCM19992_21510 [Thermostilla marina]